MGKRNHTYIDFNFDPAQFWINQKEDERPEFHPFQLDDGLDFNFDLELDDDLFKGTGIDEDDIFKMLGGTNTTFEIVTPYFNTTFNTTELPPFEPVLNGSGLDTAMPPMPKHGREHHAKKHQRTHQMKHHQRHPKNMIKEGFQFDMHKMTEKEALRSVNMMIGVVLCFAAFWATVCILFW